MVQCPSYLTIYNVLDIKEEWQKILSDQPSELVVDMSKLEEIDTAGVQLIFALKKECLEKNISLSLENWNKPIVSFVKFIGLDELLE